MKHHSRMPERKVSETIAAAQINKTMKEKRMDPLYIKTFLRKGNKKLTDYYNPDAGVYYKYAQFNIPAKKTCPFATRDCKKFCYAKRDERFVAPRENREKNFAASLDNDFVERMIYTIETELNSKRFRNAVMIVRIHESGDFYNIMYLEKWIDIMRAFRYDNRVIFQAYTKSFPLFLQLSNFDYVTLRGLMNNGRFALSLSLDDSMIEAQRADLLKVLQFLPKCNVYYAVKADRMDSIKYDTVCDCADCAKCGNCVRTEGKTIVVAIH